MNKIVDEFRGLLMAELISAPLIASCESQKKLAKAMISQVSLLAYGKDDIRTVHPGEKVISLPFNFDRPVIN